MSVTLSVNDSIDISKICRGCLGKKGDMRPLFGSYLDNMLRSVAQIQVCRLTTDCLVSFKHNSFFLFFFKKVNVGDGLPELMCVQCVLQVSRAFTFKQQCERNDQTLRIYLNQEYQKQFVTVPLLDDGDKTNNVQLVVESIEEPPPLEELQSEEITEVLPPPEPGDNKTTHVLQSNEVLFVQSIDEESPITTVCDNNLDVDDLDYSTENISNNVEFTDNVKMDTTSVSNNKTCQKELIGQNFEDYSNGKAVAAITLVQSKYFCEFCNAEFMNGVDFKVSLYFIIIETAFSVL